MKFVPAKTPLTGETLESLTARLAAHGEPAFRELESQVLAELVQLDWHALALGGGVVLRPENRELIKRAGAVLWLTADAETILARVNADVTTAARRPNLTAQGGLDEIRQLLVEREPLYRECATIAFDTVGRSLAEVADDVLRQVPIR